MSAPTMTAQAPLTIEKALRRAFYLGELHWQQADSESYSQNRKADETRAKFEALVSEVLAAAEGPGDAPALNLSDRAVQKRLAAQWGFVERAASVPSVVQAEPVAWIQHHKAGDNLVWDDPGGKKTPLYAAAPPAPALLRQPVRHISEISAQIPGGCYCPPDRCDAPVIMGMQTPCLRRNGEGQ